MEKDKFFIDDNYINNLLDASKNISDKEIESILNKAERFEGLTHSEVAALLSTEKKEYIDKISEMAGKIKSNIYGERVVIFAPLYVSDYCVNKCEYCGFNCDAKFERRKLTMDEVRAEVQILEKMGHKRLAIEAGEDKANCPLDYILECIDTIYNMKFENGEIRRVNVNIAATTVEEYQKLKDAQIGTYILFQETYHKETYERVHPKGPKHNYIYHTTAFDRAMTAGIDDVGAGVLFGLYDYKYEILALILHNEHLEKNFGVGFHTISVPRICDTDSTEDNKYEYAVSDEDFLKIVAIIRLAVPFTGMIVSTRETKEMRKKLIHIGISQMSAGSSTKVGGYSEKEVNGQQFALADNREASDIIYWLMEEGFVPSFCTACYRQGRSGDRFMMLAKSGNIKNVCLPNGLLTLKEYALDYGDSRFKELAEKIIEKHINSIKSEKVYNKTIESLKLLEEGKRDLFL